MTCVTSILCFANINHDLSLLQKVVVSLIDAIEQSLDGGRCMIDIFDDRCSGGHVHGFRKHQIDSTIRQRSDIRFLAGGRSALRGTNRRSRLHIGVAAAGQAESIIETRVQSFMEWMQSRDTVPTIRALRDHAERQRRQELERAMKQLARGDDPEKVMDYLSHALTNKLMHGPTQALSNVQHDERESLESLLRRLYHLHQE